MTNPVEQTKQVIASLIAFIEQSPWRADYLERLNNLKAQAEQPCVLAIAGRVKAGKSSFLNALLGKDLAKVGTTETTATINIFRKGTPTDPEKPVLVIWANGQQRYETKEFLDSLQGYGQAILKRAQGIKRIEFLLSDPIFDEVTLVDTPGTDAIVGEEGDEHQKVTEEFFRLRQQHSDETKEQTEGADAVIYLIGQVANASGQAFMQEFQAATGGRSSAMNAIGIMAKIDLSDGIITQRDELAAAIASKLQNELNTVIPVSAAIWRALDELQQHNRLEWMQQKLREMPQEGFDYLMKQEKIYYSTSPVFDRLFSTSMNPPLTVEERKELKGDLSWRVFVVISQHLYQYPLDEAVKRLTDISGVKRVMEIIQQHFFNRGKLLRCYRIAGELRLILNDIERNRLYIMNKEVQARKEFEEFIESHPKTQHDRKIADKLLTFLRTYLKTDQEVKELTQMIETKYISEVELLQLKLLKTNENFHALQIIEQNGSIFSDEERTELYSLFGMYGNTNENIDADICGRRQQYWNLEFNLTRSQDRRKVAQYAVSAYGNM
jgi:GTPase Era involved in 16S rRNA processing